MNILKLTLTCVLIFLTTAAFAVAPKKRVLILYSTGGHSTAAKSVEKLLSQYPEEFEVIRHDFAEDLTGFAHWFYTKGYDSISQHANWINRFGVLRKWRQADTQALYASERFNADFNQPDRILAYIERVKPDVIISTHFSLADTLALLREKGHLRNTPIAWTHLDVVDNIFFRQIGDQLDMSFLPTPQMAKAWSEVISPEKLASVGIPIMPELLNRQTPVDTDRLRISLGLEPQTPTVMLMGGSMGALSYQAIMEDIAKHFAAHTASQVQFVAICGRNHELAANLALWAASSNRPPNMTLKVESFVEQSRIREYQLASDLIVSKPGGLTTFELLTTDKPVIMAEGIGIQEKYNAEYVRDRGAALYFPNIKGIGTSVYNLLREDAKARHQLIEQQRALRVNFDLERIVRWTRTAQVLQPDRPMQTVLQRQMQNSHQSKPSLKAKVWQSCEQALVKSFNQILRPGHHPVSAP